MKSSLLTPKNNADIDLSKYTPQQRSNIRLYGLECADWTARDVFEYKTKWLKTGEIVQTFHLSQGQAWCKHNLPMHKWHVNKNAVPDDSHEFIFENSEDALLFKLSMA